MAIRVSLYNDKTMLSKTSAIGFSWTSLCWGFWPAIFRGDWLGAGIYFVASVIGGVFTAGVASLLLWILWPFFYNKWHVRRLIEQGYTITAAAGMTPEQAFDAIKK